ncbi:MAG: metal-sulfur cluster assembly factor [candidate division WOR-3 bacterium]
MQTNVRARWIITAILAIFGLVVLMLPGFLRSGRLAAIQPRQLSFRGEGVAPFDSAAPDSSRIARALASVPDPELGLSILELGLVHSLAVTDSGTVQVALALTTPACTEGANIARAALDAIVRVPGVSSARVRIDPNAVWDPARASEGIRHRLGLLLKQ